MPMMLAQFVFTALTIVALIPVAMVCIEIIASFMPAKTPHAAQELVRSTLIIPAHNEGKSLLPTLNKIAEQNPGNWSVLVVADNCTDETANLARTCLAQHATNSETQWSRVVERHNPDERGKAYALAFGLDEIADDPCDIVVFIDADCLARDGAIAQIIATAHHHQRPAQALYLMDAPENARASERVSAFAWLLINKVRMAGLARLFDVTRLTGSGMAFPRQILRDHFSGSGEIVEDLGLTLKLVEAGHPPLLVPSAIVTSTLAPSDSAASTVQRARWERGSLAMAKRAGFGLFKRSLLNGHLRGMALALDLAIPPLTLLIGGLAALMTVTTIIGLVGIAGPFFLSLWASFIFGIALVAAWWRNGRAVLPISSLSGIGSFIAQKGRIYGKEGRDSTRSWTRTDRE